MNSYDDPDDEDLDITGAGDEEEEEASEVGQDEVEGQGEVQQQEDRESLQEKLQEADKRRKNGESSDKTEGGSTGEVGQPEENSPAKGEKGENKTNSGTQPKPNANQTSNEALKKGGENATKEVAKKGTEEAAKKTATTAAKTAATSGGGAATTAGVGAALAPIIGIAAIVILFLIIIVGFVFFFQAMPGQVAAKLKQMGQDFLGKVQSYYDGQENRVHTEDIAEVANYLESMGYDLKGEGFVSSSSKSAHSNGDTAKDSEGNEFTIIYDEEQDVWRNAETDDVFDLNSDTILAYLVSDNLCYIIKNFNTNLVAASDDASFWVFGTIITALAVVVGVLLSPIAVLGVIVAGAVLFASSSNPNWGTGLIAIYHEGSGGIGDKRECV